jgi:serine/threonine protein kinase
MHLLINTYTQQILTCILDLSATMAVSIRPFRGADPLYQVLHPLGSGSFGTVYKAVDKTTRRVRFIFSNEQLTRYS